MTVTPNYMSQRQFLVDVADDDIPGYWMQKQGGNTSADSNKFFPGGDDVPVILTGLKVTDNITISRAYDAVRDGAMLRAIRDQVGSLTTSITVTETDADLKSTGVATTYSGCVLVGISEPEYESASGDAANIQLEFAVVSVA